MLRPRAAGSDGGFTLIELIVTMAILGVIVVPLGEVVISFMINAATVNGRLYESKDQQIAAEFWAQDVAALGGRTTTTFGPSAGINAGDCTPFVGTKLISLDGVRYTLAGVPTLVKVTYSESGSKIVRTSCSSGSASSLTVANTVDTSTAIVCSIDGGATWVSCSGLTGTTTDGKAQLQMEFRVASTSGKGQPYVSILGGQRRQTS